MVKHTQDDQVGDSRTRHRYRERAAEDREVAPQSFRWRHVVATAVLVALLSPLLIIFEMMVFLLLLLWASWARHRPQGLDDALLGIGLGIVPYVGTLVSVSLFG